MNTGNQSQEGTKQNVVVSVAQPSRITMVRAPSGKNRTITLLLCVFFGFFGFHRFYVGKFGTGFLYLFTLGFFWLGWLLDIFVILTGNFGDNFGNPIVEW